MSQIVVLGAVAAPAPPMPNAPNLPTTTVTATALELFNSLGAWSDADGDSTGWALLKLCEALVGSTRMDDIAQLVSDDPVTGEPGWSDLVDVDACPDIGLPWLAQMVGVRGLPTDPGSARDLIRSRPAWARGGPAGIIAAARSQLRPGGVVELHERDTSAYHATVVVYQRDLGAASYADLQRQYPTIAAFQAAYPHYADLPANSRVNDAVQAVAPALVQVDVSVIGAPGTTGSATYAALARDFPSIPAMQSALPTYAAAAAYVPTTGS